MKPSELAKAISRIVAEECQCAKNAWDCDNETGQRRGDVTRLEKARIMVRVADLFFPVPGCEEIAELGTDAVSKGVA